MNIESAPTTGVILMNLGSPDSTEVKDVRSYLNEFLMDKRVIDYPYLMRVLLVKGIITRFRAPRSAAAYQSVWTAEGSPLIVLTKQLQAALQSKTPLPVEIGMRYGNPSPKAAFDKLQQNFPGLKEVLLVPLYPHYAMSSYETAVAYAEEIYHKGNYPFTIANIKPFYNNEQYVDALSESIRPYLQQEYDQLLFSYHGLPQRHMTKADVTGQHCMKVADCCYVSSAAHKTCYRHQSFTTMELVIKKLNIPKEKTALSFQSRLGREEWLKPYTAIRLTELPKEGVKKLLVVCPAFVSDCLETLEEMAVEGKEIFLHNGGEAFTLIPCMNLHPNWVNTLGSWVEDFAKGEKRMLLEETASF